MNDEIQKPASIHTLIRKFFPERDHIVLFEVRDGAGYGATRSADALAMNLWPSRGLEVSGVEVKSNRGDWLNELKKPEKAEAIFQYCDRWWVVADRDKVVRQDEVPKTWGFAQRDGNKLVVKIPAPKLNPLGFSRSFVAALLKRASTGLIHPDTIEDRLEVARSEGRREQRAQVERLTEEADRLRSAIRNFEDASGISIPEYSGSKIGLAALFLNAGGFKNLNQDLGRVVNRIDDLASHAHRIMEELSKVEISTPSDLTKKKGSPNA